MAKVFQKVVSIIKSKEFQKFFIGGVSAFIIDFSILNILTYVFKLNTYLFGVIFLPNFISTTTAIIFNYFLQRTWTFKSQQKNLTQELVKFILVNVFNLIVFNGIIFGLLSQAGIPIPITKVIVTALQLIVSYTLYKFFVFKKAELEEAMV